MAIPHQSRVVKNFGSSARTGASTAGLLRLAVTRLRSADSGVEVSESRGPPKAARWTERAVDGQSGGERQITDSDQIVGLGGEHAIVAELHSDPRRPECLSEPGRVGGRTRRCGPPTGLDRAAGDEAAVGDDGDVVDHLVHLSEQMAGDQDGHPLAGEIAEQLAQPANALGVEPVGRLVEDEDRRLPRRAAASRAAGASPIEYWPARLRAAAGIPTGRASRRPGSSAPGRRRRGRAGGPGRSDRGGSSSPPAPPDCLRRVWEVGIPTAADGGRTGGGDQPRIIRGSWSCRRHWARGSR